MVFERPKRPGQSNPATNRPNPALQRAGSGKPKKVITTGGANRSGNSGGSNRGGNGGNGNSGDRSGPSPWIEHPFDPDPNPHATASFVEYLRWMRSPDSDYKDPTKVQILQMAEENANYRDRLSQLTRRTQLIADAQKGTTFQVKCLWRIRVGGHRGPESILLPAFDALGMPYIPSSTLRGVARTQAIRELMAEENLSWNRAEEAVSRNYFGFLDSKNGEERSGKVIFLDAYPIPQQSGDGDGLAVDMANSIWSWDTAGRNLLYSPNPNPFFSLEEATFLIGMCPASNGDSKILEKVQQWLSRGLHSGIGSQVNTGYGSLIRAGQSAPADEFFSVDFTLKGQLIHGRQELKDVYAPFQRDHYGKLRTDNKGNLKVDSFPDAEVRPVAFKSMLRYWFRAFASGFLPVPQLRRLEASLFGSIDSHLRARGWVKFQALERDYFNETDDEPAQQIGTLKLYSSEGLPSDKHKILIQDLFTSLTWMAFRLGGVGQGARRPCYSRRKNPKWRGSTFMVNPDDPFWKNPETTQEFRGEFQQQLRVFHKTLVDLVSLERLPCRVSEINKPLTALNVEPHSWVDAVDSTCRIFAIDGIYEGQKPQTLALLHQKLHQLEEEAARLKEKSRKLNDRRLLGESMQKLSEAKSLCGGTTKDFVQINNQRKERLAIPSPIWFADLGDFHVVTVFGATRDPRQKYVNELQQQINRSNYVQLWPFQ